jgi:hypothetical protein
VFYRRDARPGEFYVVKQAAQSAPALAHEAAVLRVLAGALELKAYVPTVVHHDAGAARTAGGTRDWSVHHSAGRFPRMPARVLGGALAAFHRLPVPRVEKLPPGFDRMWALSLPEPPRELLLDLSLVAQDLVARLQASRLGAIGSTGCGMRARTTAYCTDLRWDNCLAVAAPGSRRAWLFVRLQDREIPSPLELHIPT